MVAYNFKQQFAEAIRSGKKNHTIRANGKRRHANAGELLQLYTGMRTKHCRKILDKDPVCDGSLEILIDVLPDRIDSIIVGGFPIEDLNGFAVSDGFESIAAMHKFFFEMHGSGRFAGTLIEWRRA
jgi:hypothetical protein